MNDVALTLPTREQLDRFQSLISRYPQFEPVTRHYFSGGMYCREVLQPEDSCVVGKEHLKPHFFILLKGEMTVVGNYYRKHIDAPFVFEAQGGDKRALYAHKNSVYITVHKTDKTDLDEIERELIKEEDTSLFDSSNKLKFDVVKFRKQTLRVIANEKPGFWSDWTPEERELYSTDQWEKFSRSRGYTEKQIDDFREWLRMISEAKSRGVNPFKLIKDLALAAASDNLLMDKKGEIMKSSRLPKEITV
ncbi:MAG: hypothetical protein KGL39_13855 [Patescibacteria group bacterium]|nr:hypothetical protein [Patescibacteria group bacterium]